LIRSFKTPEQDLVELIQVKIQNSANRSTEAVEQEIGPVSEECLDPSAANEQLVDKLNNQTGADTDVGNVTAEHHPVKGRIEDNVTLHSDATEGTEMVDTAVDAAERKERNSLDHSVDWPLWSVGNEFPEGLVSSERNSVAEKIALKESLIQGESRIQGTEMMDTAIDPAERKERNSRHLSHDAEWPERSEWPILPRQPARNLFSEAFSSLGIQSRDEKIAVMESVVQEKRRSRSSRTSEASYRVPCLTIFFDDTLSESILTFSTVQETGGTWGSVEKE